MMMKNCMGKFVVIDQHRKKSILRNMDPYFPGSCCCPPPRPNTHTDTGLPVRQSVPERD
jgi:hypothetical protein